MGDIPLLEKIVLASVSNQWPRRRTEARHRYEKQRGSAAGTPSIGLKHRGSAASTPSIGCQPRGSAEHAIDRMPATGQRRVDR